MSINNFYTKWNSFKIYNYFYNDCLKHLFFNIGIYNSPRSSIIIYPSLDSLFKSTHITPVGDFQRCLTTANYISVDSKIIYKCSSSQLLLSAPIHFFLTSYVSIESERKKPIISLKQQYLVELVTLRNELSYKNELIQTLQDQLLKKDILINE